MSTYLLIGLLLVLVLVIIVWARRRATQIAEASSRREQQALELMRNGLDPNAVQPGGQVETVFGESMPTQYRVHHGIEVAEMAPLELEQLLADETLAAAERARALLEEPTNIDVGMITLPPRPAVPVQTAAQPVAQPIARPMASEAAVRPMASQAAAQPAVPAAKPPAVAAPMAAAHAAQVRSVVPNGGGHAAAAIGAAAVMPPVASVAPLRPASPPKTPVAAAPVKGGGAPGGDVPLREVVLAWFEARGYRASPASPVVRPIELVLRHRDDPARAYAFVVATDRVDGERVQQLAKQARGIGLIRVLIVADAGLASEAPAAKKGVRVMDRAAMNDEMKKLDVSIAAKIIAVARKRAAAAA